MTAMSLTPRERDCLRAYQELTVDGVGPTYDQLCKRLDVRSKSGISRLMSALEASGAIVRLPTRRGAVQIVAGTPEADMRAMLRRYGREAVRGAFRMVCGGEG